LATSGDAIRKVPSASEEKMNKKLIQLLAGLALALSASTAQATTITFAYSASDADGTVTGVFGYDDSVGDTAPGTVAGVYPSAGFFNGTVNGGLQDGFAFNRTNVNIQISNDRATFLGFGDDFGINDLSSGTFIAFVSPPSSAPPTLPLDSDALASPVLIDALLNPAAWDFIDLLVVDAPDRQLRYNLTSVRQISQVPEPGTLTLLAFSLSGLMYRRLKHRQS